MAKLPRQIELRHLRYFLASADEGSFRKAGIMLGVQESAISRRIRDLEDILGASLFQRYNSGVSLTYAGQQFLHRAREIGIQLGNAARSVGEAGRSEAGHIRIGIFSSIASGFVADLLRTYLSRHEGVTIELIDGGPTDHIAALRQMRIDVAFLIGERTWPGCENIQLWSERVFAVLSQAHPLAAVQSFSWRDLAAETFIVSDADGPDIHDYLRRRIEDIGHRPCIHVQHVGRDNLLPLIALGRCLTLTSEAATVTSFPGIVYRPIANEHLPFNAVWSSRNDNPAFRRLLSMARQASSSLPTPVPNGPGLLGRGVGVEPQSLRPLGRDQISE